MPARVSKTPSNQTRLSPSGQFPATPKNVPKPAAYFALPSTSEFALYKSLADRIRLPLGKKDRESGVLYTAHSRNHRVVKVGFSASDPEERVRQILASCKLHVDQQFYSCTIVGAYRMERIIHTYFQTFRSERFNCECNKHNREWYAEKYDLLTGLVILIEQWMEKEPYDLSSADKTLKPEWLNALWEWEKSLVTAEPINIFSFFARGPDIFASGEIPSTPSLRKSLYKRKQRYFGDQTEPFPIGSECENSTTVPMVAGSENLAEIERLLEEEPETFEDSDYAESPMPASKGNRLLEKRLAGNESQASGTPTPGDRRSPAAMTDRSSSPLRITSAIKVWKRRLIYLWGLFKQQYGEIAAEFSVDYAVSETETLQESLVTKQQIVSFSSRMAVQGYDQLSAPADGKIADLVTNAIKEFHISKRMPGSWPTDDEDAEYSGDVLGNRLHRGNSGDECQKHAQISALTQEGDDVPLIHVHSPDFSDSDSSRASSPSPSERHSWANAEQSSNDETEQESYPSTEDHEPLQDVARQSNQKQLAEQHRNSGSQQSEQADGKSTIPQIILADLKDFKFTFGKQSD